MINRLMKIAAIKCSN